jgi:RNA 2',3'-cyclic 3'-phosphodiesterase
VRLFVAVWPPDEVLDRLAAIEHPDGLAGVRWTARSQWHVTLRFLGEVADGAVPDAIAAVGEAVGAMSPVSVEVADRLSRFGREIAHVEVRGLEPWADAVATAFDRARIGLPSEGRPFVGHITVARAAKRAASAVTALSGASLPPGPASWTASEVALVRSELGRGGARYSNVSVDGRAVAVRPVCPTLSPW